MVEERRQISRRNFSYYMRVVDEADGKLVGHFSDISTGGFKLDSTKALPINRDYRLRIDQTGEISNKSYITFTARARWCSVDSIDPNLYNVGFQIVTMSPGDYEIFLKMFSTYGVQQGL
jgi:PilZ domain